jgi:hypothetical protein
MNIDNEKKHLSESEEDLEDDVNDQEETLDEPSSVPIKKTKSREDPQKIVELRKKFRDKEYLVKGKHSNSSQTAPR